MITEGERYIIELQNEKGILSQSYDIVYSLEEAEKVAVMLLNETGWYGKVIIHKEKIRIIRNKKPTRVFRKT